MSHSNSGSRVLLPFLRNLRRHIIDTYQRAQSEAVSLEEAAESMYSRVHRTYFSPTATSGDQSQTEILDRYLDYHLRARDAAGRAARYQAAFLYVSDRKPSEIDTAHSSIQSIASQYFPWWQQQWMREQQRIAHVCGLVLNFARLQPEPQVQSIEDDGDYNADAPYYESYEDEEDGEERDETWGHYEVYSAVAPTTPEPDDDLDVPDELEPQPQDVPLEALIEQSAQRDVLTGIAAEYLKPADLVGAGVLEVLRIRHVLYEVFKRAQANPLMDEERILQDVDVLLDEAIARDPMPFPPPFQRHSSGYGQFMRAQIAYEGTAAEDDKWTIIDDV